MSFIRIASISAALAAASLFAAPAHAGFDVKSIESGADFSRYSSVYIQPVQSVVNGAQSQLRGSRLETRLTEQDWREQEQQLANYLRKHLSRDYAIAESEGPNVLVVQAILTDLRPSRATADQLGTQRGGLQSGLGAVQLGGAAVQIELRDGATGALLGRLQDEEYRKNFNDRTLDGTWGDAILAYDEWGRDLRKLLKKGR